MCTYMFFQSFERNHGRSLEDLHVISTPLQFLTIFVNYTLCTVYKPVLSIEALRGSLCKNLMTSLDQETDSSQTL